MLEVFSSDLYNSFETDFSVRLKLAISPLGGCHPTTSGKKLLQKTDLLVIISGII